VPRPKRQVVYALPGSSLAAVRKKLPASINALLTAANRGRKGADGASPFDRDVDRVLSALARNESKGSFHGWPVWAGIALINLRSNLRNGDYHLRLCKECASWMLVKYAGRWICNRSHCATTANIKRVYGARHVKRAQDQAILAAAQRDLTEVRKSRTRPRRQS
jgi:hypothetical protein